MQSFKTVKMLGMLAASIAAAGLTGCSTWGHHEGDRTAGRVIDDKNITAHVQTALSTAPVYKFNDVDVKTFNGVVQLSGFVTTDEQKNKAGEIAQRVEGVNQVINNIVLKQGVPTPTGRVDTNPNYNRNYPNNVNNSNR